MLGRDCRLSSPLFRDALVEGLLSTGMDVVDVGICPTPLLYFSIVQYGAEGGAMITGSHNPPEFNGFKMCIGDVTLYGEMIQEIRRIIEQGDFASGRGRESRREVLTDYREYVKANISIPRSLKVVVDAGNGTASAVAPTLFRELGMEVVELFCEMDGRFPNHFPDPTIPENLRFLVRTVRETGADVGVAFDGDADRIGAVNERGEILFGDYLLLLFAREILRRKPGATVISEVKASQNLYDDISRNGGRPVMWKAGHSLIKKKMKEESAEVAGEMSGHIFFAERWYGFDDGLYTGARLLEVLSRSADPSAVLEALPDSVTTPELHLQLAEGEPHRLIAELQRDAQFPGATEVLTLDGLRVEYPDGFGLARASNTTPVIVLRFEANDAAGLRRIQGAFRSVLLAAKPDAKLPF